MKNSNIRLLSLSVIITACTSLTLLGAGGNNSSLLGTMVRAGADRPIFGYCEQLQLAKTNSGISKIGFGFDGEVNDTLVYGIDYIHKKYYARTQFCNIGFGYKYYADKKDKSYPFVDFTFFKTSKIDEVFGGLCLGAYLNIIDKKTTWYSKNDIDWFDAGFMFGYDFTASNSDLTIAPILSLGFGVESAKVDTINCPNVPDNYRGYYYHVGECSAKVQTRYKSLSLDISTSAKGGFGDNLYTTKSSAELSYTLWKERKTSPGETQTYQYYLNALKITASYNSESVKLGSSPSAKYSFSTELIKFGISGRLGKIEFYKD